jgi:hypothetical protein
MWPSRRHQAGAEDRPGEGHPHGGSVAVVLYQPEGPFQGDKSKQEA